MALLGKTAEIIEHFQWLNEGQNNCLSAVKKQELAEELGNTFIYPVRLADKLGIDLLGAVFGKLEKNRTKYPAKLVKGKDRKIYISSFGRRFGDRKSQAEAEKRREERRSRTTFAEPPAESPTIIRRCRKPSHQGPNSN